MLDRILNKKKKRPNLYFAVVIADRDTAGFKFTPDKDCTVFMVTGDVESHDIIPRSVLKEMVERFLNPKEEEKDLVKISEKRI